MDKNSRRPKWLEPYEELANEQLSDDNGSACNQIHPIIERWYDHLMTQDPPESRDAVLQAISCLSTELINDMPESLFDAVFSENTVEFDDFALWVQEILMIGRAFQISLEKGELDDL